ncbi:patatin-like phospholipase family protein [Nodosilinea sp. LEGE 07298]|uniref:patatin-like phospholipase family protein n=1 Tax=Nodosilinea sp. LEGE 07298 TaxID=2777970 RepID=UPI001881603F|nr:patatin-like phospholipase family protein [Nodosilinea sp. LEGE 07298]MBE9108962.1 patatin-like phospholipase family protein [Nodosilinea sp. LEGE 07298]
MKKIDAVFEGGGVKGIGLVGAFSVIEEAGYTLQNIAGTSAGAIVAALIAAGYNAAEVKKIVEDLNFNQIMDEGWEDKIPLVGRFISLIHEKGIYEGVFFENLIRKLLADKNIYTFKDLIIEDNKDNPRYRYKLQVIASDLTAGRMMVLPRDIARFGIDPDDMDVAQAVRMSMSIPFFFEPVQLKDSDGKDHYIVDGGLLSNYPVWLFDDGTADPAWPTFGYNLVDPDQNEPHPINGPISMFKALFSTMMEAHDARYIEAQHFVRTIPIPTGGVHTTEFDISAEKKAALYESGREAARQFLATWDFEEYKQQFRASQVPSRTQRLWTEAEEA